MALNRHGCGADLTQQLTSSPRKTLDEASFQEMLAAAYVVQNHNQLPDDSNSNYPDVIAEVLRIQRIIRSGRSSLLSTARLICEQVQGFTGSSGAAIGIVVGTELTYLAALGNASRQIGLRAKQESSLPAYSLETGHILLSPDVDQDSRISSIASSKSGTRSLIAVPVEFESKVVGVLEARFNSPNAFSEDDVRACEVMAQLVRELIVRAGHAGPSPKIELDESGETQVISGLETDSLSHELTTPVISPPEPLMTQLGPSIAESAQSSAVPVSETTEIQPKLEDGDASVETVSCRGCGEELASDKSYCGKCGTEKTSKTDGPLQTKWASMWFMEQAKKKAGAEEDPGKSETSSEGAPYEASLVEPTKVLSLKGAPAEDSALVSPTELTRPGEDHPQSSIHVEWLPVSSSRESWLRHQWRVNRANFYVAGAALLLILALSGVGTLPEQSFPAANPSRPKLTLFESMLVSMGLAEAPSTPVYKGNPDTPVWVDMHTALYYCPGSDLYGKTEGGKIASQRDAQLDQFEPAHRRACN